MLARRTRSRGMKSTPPAAGLSREGNVSTILELIGSFTLYVLGKKYVTCVSEEFTLATDKGRGER